jgi:hypothetical protein
MLLPLQLPGPGPFVLPTIEGCPGLAIDQVSGLVQLRLLDAVGTEVRAPMQKAALQKLRDLLVEYLGGNAPNETN